MMQRQLIVILALAWSVVSWAGAQENITGYTWQEVAKDIYLHRQTEPLAAPIDGNCVVIVNDADVFVVDTHINPAAARAVLRQLRQITDKPVTHIVNTHWHDDHTNGNYVFRHAFPQASIIAHRATLKSLMKEWPAMEAQRKKAYKAADRLQLLAQATENERTDPDRAAGLRMFADYKQALEAELATLELVYPDTVFGDYLEFHRGDRSIRIEWLGRGNTDGDVVVWLPNDKVLITGDLLVAPIPYAFDSPMVHWIETLDRLADKDARLIIPGHGAPQKDMQYLRQTQALLRETVAAVRTAHAQGVSLADIATAVDLTGSEKQFVGTDSARAYAWRTFFVQPALRSAWLSLGYPVPDQRD